MYTMRETDCEENIRISKDYISMGYRKTFNSDEYDFWGTKTRLWDNNKSHEIHSSGLALYTIFLTDLVENNLSNEKEVELHVNCQQ